MIVSRLNDILIEASRSLDRTQDYRCPSCDEAVVLKAGVKKIAHFAHKVNSDCQHGVGETQWHLAAKSNLAKYLRAEGFEVELEKPLGNRRADLFASHPTKGTKVYEMQRKCIGREIYNRTSDLLRYCDTVTWVLPWDAKPMEGGFRVTATYMINALLSDTKSPRKTNVRFFDHKENVVYRCNRRPWQLYKEETYNDYTGESYGGYFYTSKRWCALDPIQTWELT